MEAPISDRRKIFNMGKHKEHIFKKNRVISVIIDENGHLLAKFKLTIIKVDMK